jgi:predicted TIM-barrel fold metal-dependent hydrolase
MGHLPEPEGAQHPAFRVIADLIEKQGAWVKLTGAYILSKVGPPTYADRSELAKAYVKLAPERLVWGTDWPLDLPPSSGGVRSEYQAASRKVIASMLARASTGVR